MIARHQHQRPEMECTYCAPRFSLRVPIILTGVEMDIRSLDFEDNSFDVVIDKGRLSLLVFIALFRPTDGQAQWTR